MMSKELHSKTTAVPSFASFKKQETSSIPLVAASKEPAKDLARKNRDSSDTLGIRSKLESNDHDHGHHRRRHHSRHSGSGHRKSPDPSSSRHRVRSKDRHQSPAKLAGDVAAAAPTSHTSISASAAKQQQPDSSANALYVIDGRGDPLILRYGSNDRSQVPGYRRSGRGRVLGQPVGFLETDREGAKEVFSIRSARERGSVFREKNGAQLKFGTGPVKHVIPKVRTQSDAAKATEEMEFLPIRNRQKRKRRQEDGDFSHSLGPQSEQDASDSDVTTSDEDQMDFDNFGHKDGQEEPQETTKRFIELSRQVKEHPEDVESWFSLIELQETRLRFDTDETEKETYSKSLAQVKLFMFESALKHSKSDVDRERLLLGLMREGRHLWGPKILANRWESIYKEHSHSFPIWKAYLDHMMTDVTSFTFEELEGFTQRRLDFLRAELYLATFKSASAQEMIDLCGELLYVFLRLTIYLWDTGFVERAVASWQAILELTFCRPSELNSSSAEYCMSDFRNFWESEVPRFGEEGHQGWHSFADSDQDVPEPRMLAPLEPPSSRDVYKAWAATERHRYLSSGMSARTVDQDAVDDPLRVVMFSDIESILFVIPSAVIPQVRAQISEALAQFCRLPSTRDSNSLVGAARGDPFVSGIHTNLQAAIDSKVDDQPHGLLSEDQGPKKEPQFLHDDPRMAFSTDLLFVGSGWFSYGTPTIAPERKYSPRDFYEWTCMVMQELALKHNVEELGELHLYLRWSHEPQNTRKTAKGLLRLYPLSTELYRAYACAEYSNGNAEMAKTVLLSAAKQRLSSDAGKTQSLWNTLVWMELDRTNLTNAVAALCWSAEGEAGMAVATVDPPRPTPTQILKARQIFQTMRDYQLSSGNVDGAVVFGESSILLDYLTSQDGQDTYSAKQGNISAAVSNVLSFSGELSARGKVAQSQSHERFLQFASRLVYFHARLGSYKPASLRVTFSHFITLFPRNTMFLALFAWAESSLRLDDPVRRLLQRTILVEPNDTLSGRIFAVRHELRIGNAYSARAAFEQAMATDRSAGDPHLWIAYVRLCCSRKELRAKAKDVFYRAVTACPWSKEVIMEGFGGGLIREMASDELRALYTTMSARGLRIHVDLEEFADQWRRLKDRGKVVK